MEAEKEVDMSAFADELQNALDAAQEKEVVPQEAVEEKEVEDEEQEVSGEDQADDETEDQTEEQPQEEDEEEGESFTLIPSEWTEEEKREFEQILENPDLEKSAKIMIDRYGSLKKGFYKKADELAKTKRDLSEWSEIFDPYQEALKQRGYTPASYVNSLLNVDRQLAQDPAAVIKQLMESYKVTPEKLGFSNDADDYYEDDKISRLEKEIESLKNQGKQEKELTSRQQADENARMVREFKFAIDESGEPKYPMFEEVKEEMAILLDKGKATTLEDAYFKSPTVKEKLVEEREEKKKKEELVAARKKAASAKKAGRGVKTSSSASYSGPDNRDLETMLTEGFKERGLI